VAYPISYRQIDEMMREREEEVDHSTLNRWVLKCVTALEKASLTRKRPVGGSWRLDKTYVRVKGGANTAAIVSYNADRDTDIEIRQIEYLNNSD
jgi:transposase-like protein